MISANPPKCQLLNKKQMTVSFQSTPLQDFCVPDDFFHKHSTIIEFLACNDQNHGLLAHFKNTVSVRDLVWLFFLSSNIHLGTFWLISVFLTSAIILFEDSALLLEREQIRRHKCFAPDNI